MPPCFVVLPQTYLSGSRLTKRGVEEVSRIHIIEFAIQVCYGQLIDELL